MPYGKTWRQNKKTTTENKKTKWYSLLFPQFLSIGEMTVNKSLARWQCNGFNGTSRRQFWIWCKLRWTDSSMSISGRHRASLQVRFRVDIKSDIGSMFKLLAGRWWAEILRDNRVERRKYAIVDVGRSSRRFACLVSCLCKIPISARCIHLFCSDVGPSFSKRGILAVEWMHYAVVDVGPTTRRVAGQISDRCLYRYRVDMNITSNIVPIKM